VDRAAGLAERDSAVHAARALLGRLVVLQRKNELAVVAHSLACRLRRFGDALQFEKPGDLAHRCSIRGDRARATAVRSPA
jgi:hypothetical protein